jgi:hypothetical protein
MTRTSNSIAIINMRLNTNSCALSSCKVLSFSPLFLNTENTEFRVSVPSTFLTKKIRGRLLGIFELLRAQLLVRRRVLVMVTHYLRFSSPIRTQNRKNKIDRYVRERFGAVLLYFLWHQCKNDIYLLPPFQGDVFIIRYPPQRGGR